MHNNQILFARVLWHFSSHTIVLRRRWILGPWKFYKLNINLMKFSYSSTHYILHFQSSLTWKLECLQLPGRIEASNLETLNLVFIWVFLHHVTCVINKYFLGQLEPYVGKYFNLPRTLLNNKIQWLTRRKRLQWCQGTRPHCF